MTYTHTWHCHKYLGEKYGMPCRVLVYARRRACLVEFWDGSKAVTRLTLVRRGR